MSDTASGEAGSPRAGLPAASGIVLAGGRSERFGRDKLAELLDGRPLLDHAVAGVAAVVLEVVVVGRPTVTMAPAARDGLPGVPTMRVRHVPDLASFEGPLAGLAAALEHVREPIGLVVGGDMPSLARPVLALLLRVLEAEAFVDAVALRYRGRREPLPIAIRVGAADSVIRRLLAARERRLGALADGLRTRDLDEVEWRALDPRAATLRDVDRPEDLAALDRR